MVVTPVLRGSAWPAPLVTVKPDMSDQEQGETSELVSMAADKKLVVSDTGLCNFWALTWLVAWYVFSGEYNPPSSLSTNIAVQASHFS